MSTGRTQLTANDLRRVVSTLPREVVHIAKEYRIIIGGGFIRDRIAGARPSDVDLFAEDDEVGLSAAGRISLQRHPLEVRSVETENAITLVSPGKLPIQMIRRWNYSMPDQVVDSFDFTVCAAAVAFRGGLWLSSCHESFYADLAARRLVYTAPQRVEDSGGSLLRAFKFVGRGYRIFAPDIAGVVARAVKDLNSVDVCGERVFRDSLIKELREVDPLRIVDGIPVDEEEW